MISSSFTFFVFFLELMLFSVRFDNGNFHNTALGIWVSYLFLITLTSVLLLFITGSYGFLLAEFVVGVFLQVLGLPFVSVSQVSLFSKVTPEKAQGKLALNSNDKEHTPLFQHTSHFKGVKANASFYGSIF